MTTFHSTLPARAAIARPYYREGLPKWKNVGYFPKFKLRGVHPEQFTPQPHQPASLTAGRVKPLKNLPSMSAQAKVESAPGEKVTSVVSKKLSTEAPTKMLQQGQFTEIKVPKEFDVPKYQPWAHPPVHVQQDAAHGGPVVTDGATKKSIVSVNRKTLGRSIASSPSNVHTRTNDLTVKSGGATPPTLTNGPVGPFARDRQGRKDEIAATQAEIARVKASLV